jgi:hypothetical protein
VFPEKRQAIDYAQCRACFRYGEIRILDLTGKLERTIAFNETDRRLLSQALTPHSLIDRFGRFKRFSSHAHKGSIAALTNAS